MAKYNNKSSEFVKKLKMHKPDDMEYYVPMSNDKDIHKFVDRCEKVIRASKEYRDYIAFLKENVGLDSCIFFQKVTQNKNAKQRGKISLELHHEPFTLYDIVKVVVTKYKEEGLPMNDLLIADEVLDLHYSNKVGLVPLSKTAHEMVHNSTKLFVPLNMVYGNYSSFLEEYELYLDKNPELYQKLEKKLDMTKNLTPESFEALTKEFTYIEVPEYEDIEKVPIEVTNNQTA